MRCFHQQVAEHPRAGFTNPQKAFALSRGTFHRIEARISSYLSLVAKATDRLQRVHNAKGGEQANAATPISAAGEDEHGANVEFDSAGNAVAVWFYNPWDGSSYVQAASRPAGGAWQAAQNLSAPNTVNYYGPDLALTPSGTAVAVWTGTVSAVDRIDAAIKPAGTTAWGPAQTISASGVRASVPHVAVDDAGDAVSAWNEGFDTEGMIQVAGFDGAGPVLADLSIPEEGQPGVPLSFSVAPFDVWSQVAAPAAWSFGDGTDASGDNVTHTYD